MCEGKLEAKMAAKLGKKLLPTECFQSSSHPIDRQLTAKKDQKRANQHVARKRLVAYDQVWMMPAAPCRGFHQSDDL